jgi:ElaB/YqjD/DUF883 family membrane-anchored ribosome-binding protein
MHGSKLIIGTGLSAYPKEPAPKSKQRESIMTEHTEEGRDRLVDDMSAVLSEAEEMLKRAATETGDKARDLRSQVETNLLRGESSSCRSTRARRSITRKRGALHRRLRARQSVARGRRRRAVGLLIGLLMNRR